MTDKEIRELLEESLAVQESDIVSNWLKKHSLAVALTILAASLLVRWVHP